VTRALVLLFATAVATGCGAHRVVVSAAERPLGGIALVRAPVGVLTYGFGFHATHGVKQALLWDEELARGMELVGP